MSKYFEYSHVVCFEETNLVGNVYFVNYFKWQGRCREMFLQEKAYEIVKDLESGKLALITLNASCNFLNELRAFDRVSVQMLLEQMQHNRVKMKFNYYRRNDTGLELVATGIHEAGCFEKTENGLAPVAIPEVLRNALNEYQQQ